MTRAALEAMFLRSEFPDGWQEGRRFGVAEGAAVIAGLGSATGLVLPPQVEERRGMDGADRLQVSYKNRRARTWLADRDGPRRSVQVSELF
jgi:hypothetical protein|eukprot:COSAG06_NODE_2796_length_6270_cov_28.221358_5_plen_91_part_00